MTRLQSLSGSAIFLVVAPGSVAGLAPWLITGWRLAPENPVLFWFGAILAALFGFMLLECFFRFAWTAFGTPAPMAPTRMLVVSGLYRHVRNPMYVAVVGLILGQAMLFANIALVAYAAVVWFCFDLFVRLYEEPTLESAYPEAYPPYKTAVPRWLPRFTPWTPSGNGSTPP